MTYAEDYAKYEIDRRLYEAQDDWRPWKALNERYKTLMQQYNQAMEEYHRQMQEAEESTHKDGYLPFVTDQPLNMPFGETWQWNPSGMIRNVQPMNNNEFVPRNGKLKWSNTPTGWYALDNGQTLTITYENPKSAYTMNDIPIGKVRFTYKNIGKYFCVIKVLDDPASTLHCYGTEIDGTKVQVTMSMFDRDDQPVDLGNALIALSSLNCASPIEYEYVESLNIPAYKINGSTVHEILGGAWRSEVNNSYKSFGSKYETNEWDYPGSPLLYYGSAVAKVPKVDLGFYDVQMVFGKTRGWLWFALNGAVASHGTPLKPVEPVAPIRKGVKPWAMRSNKQIVRSLNRKTGWFKVRKSGIWEDASTVYFEEVGIDRVGTSQIRKSGVFKGQSKIGNEDPLLEDEH